MWRKIEKHLLHNQVIRYLVSGFIAATVLFSTLVFFSEWLGLWYMYASAIAVVCAFLTSFTLQKFWTFKSAEGGIVQANKQFLVFFLVSCVSLMANAAGMYIFVEVFEVWYLLAQFITTSLVAFFSFFIYRDMIFN